MITDGIREMLIKQAEKAPIDSELRAIVDWITVGRYTTFQSSEWCQASQKNYAQIKGWPGEPSLAMTRSDFTFLGEGERWITEDHDLNTAKVRPPTCEWRHKKNGDNDQRIIFSGDNSSRSYCIVDAGLRIYHRSKRLGMKDSDPMAVCVVKGETRFITARKVTSLLREAAQEVLGLQKNDPVVKQ